MTRAGRTGTTSVSDPALARVIPIIDPRHRRADHRIHRLRSPKPSTTRVGPRQGSRRVRRVVRHARLRPGQGAVEGRRSHRRERPRSSPRLESLKRRLSRRRQAQIITKVGVGVVPLLRRLVHQDRRPIARGRQHRWPDRGRLATCTTYTLARALRRGRADLPVGTGPSSITAPRLAPSLAAGCSSVIKNPPRKHHFRHWCWTASLLRPEWPEGVGQLGERLRPHRRCGDHPRPPPDVEKVGLHRFDGGPVGRSLHAAARQQPQQGHPSSSAASHRW